MKMRILFLKINLYVLEFNCDLKKKRTLKKLPQDIELGDFHGISSTLPAG